jgi:hypothetical protein
MLSFIPETFKLDNPDLLDISKGDYVIQPWMSDGFSLTVGGLPLLHSHFKAKDYPTKVSKLSRINSFNMDAIAYLMKYTWSVDNGEFRLVYRPVDHSPLEDFSWLAKAGYTVKGKYVTESGHAITPQGTIVIWEKYDTYTTLARTYLSTAILLYNEGILFDYIPYPSHTENVLYSYLTDRHFHIEKR